MGLRSTYDTGVFGSGFFGIQETTQAAASVSVGVSVSASAVTIVDASSSASVGLSASNPSGVIIKDASASVSLSGIVSVSAVKYEVEAGFRAGYGLNTYGSFMYGKNISVESASATASISASVAVGYEVIRQVSASPDISVGFTSHGVIDVVGRATVSVSIFPDITYNRVRLFSGSAAIAVEPDVSARYKWLDADDPETTWTAASDPSNTWVEADYLERAA